MPLIITEIEKAVWDLQHGKPVAIPTETVYGLAATIDNEEAIKTVFSMKNRPLNHPLIIHVADHWNLDELVENIPDYAKKLIKHFWPGPLTLVLNSKKNQINPLITGGQTTVAIRCPAHPVAQKLLKQLSVPLVAPSANPFGKISPTTASHVAQSFADIDFTILDGGRCSVGIESTIVDATNTQSYQILRHGLIDEKAIEAVIKASCIETHNEIRVPGKLDSHYQPNKTLYYFEHYDVLNRFCQKRDGDVYVIASNQPESVKEQHFHRQSNQPETAAYELYYQLREADESNALCIAIELPPAHGKWQGVRERILKAGFLYSTES